MLGLLSIRLILLSVNKVYQDLKGKAPIYSNCLGALGRVRDLPPFRIPTCCKHSDIMKTILVNCGDLTFERVYEHVAVHQDDSKAFHKLKHPVQLNRACDAGAKTKIHKQTLDNLPFQAKNNVRHRRPHQVCSTQTVDKRSLPLNKNSIGASIQRGRLAHSP